MTTYGRKTTRGFWNFVLGVTCALGAEMSNNPLERAAREFVTSNTKIQEVVLRVQEYAEEEHAEEDDKRLYRLLQTYLSV